MSESIFMMAVLVVAIAVVAAISLFAVSKIKSGSATGQVFDPDLLLKPIREQIREIIDRLNQTSTTLTETRVSINTELGHVLSVSKDVQSQNEALNLKTTEISTALQGTGVRGNWGQVSLKRVAELAGLSKHITFIEQKKFKDEEGGITPDMIVDLSDGRKVVVDAKAPEINLKGDQEYSASERLKKHIDDLEERDYSKRIGGAVDFTVLFVPTEGVLSTALTENPNLTEYALTKKILLATPMSLLALLRAIEFGWKQSDQIENVAKILEESKELCNRFGILAEHIENIGEGLKAAAEGYDAAVRSFNRTLQPQIRKVGELGIDVSRNRTDFVEIDFRQEGSEER